MLFFLLAAGTDWVDQMIRFGEWFLKTGSIYGLGFVLISALTAIFIVFIWKLMVHLIAILQSLREWIPRLAQGHFELMTALKSSITSLAESHEADAQALAQAQANSEVFGAALTKAADSWTRAVDRLERRTA